MDASFLIGLAALVMAVASGGFLLVYFVFPKRETNLRSLMSGTAADNARMSTSETRARLRNDPTGEELEKLKSFTKKKAKQKIELSLDEKFFQAGMFSDKEKSDFTRLRIIIPSIVTPLFMFLGSYIDARFIMIGGVFGLLAGYQIPFSILDRRIKQRAEDIMFYLPLVIEQIVIGVSSSLDTGPCIQRVVAMADERDSHNAVSELLRHAQYYVKSGASLEEALTEIGKLSGHTELKHAFMSLAQVAKHGGEITRQLQELADAVASQREAKIEGKIKRLELEATGPVALVFVGFMLILMIGFGTQVMSALG